VTISNQLLEVAVKNKESLRPLVEKNLQAIEIIRHTQKLPSNYQDIAETILSTHIHTAPHHEQSSPVPLQ